MASARTHTLESTASSVAIYPDDCRFSWVVTVEIVYHRFMRVAVVCKDTLVREAIASLLTHEGPFSVAGGADSVSGAIRVVGTDSRSVIVVVASGLSVEDWVELGEAKALNQVQVILVVPSNNSSAAYRVADAVVRDTDGSNTLISAVKRFIDTVNPAERPLQAMQAGTHPLIVAEGIHQTYGGRRLTRRELEVAQLVAQGMANRRISQVLDLQEQSVKNLVSSIMRKLNCENRTQVALKLHGTAQA